jgi:ABC-type multidrug transport system ATPase subunit
MLKIEYQEGSSYLHCTIFPKTFVFLKNFNAMQWNNFCDFLSKSSLKKNLGVLPSFEFFRQELTVFQNLEIVSRFFSAERLVLPFFHYFEIEKAKHLSDLTFEERAILPFSIFFFKEANVFLAKIPDVSLSQTMLQKIYGLLSSKLESQNCVIFYTTQSLNSLEFENEISVNIL